MPPRSKHPLRIAVLYTRAGQANPLTSKKAKEAEDLRINALDAAEALSGLGHAVTCVDFGQDVCKLAGRLRKLHPHVVFNLAESPLESYEKEPHAAALLELLGLPYTGNGPSPLMACKNKAVAKERLQVAGLPTPGFLVFAALPAHAPQLSYPVVVKPLRQDGSLGITDQSVVDSPKALRRAVAYVLENQRQEALVEEFVSGREFNVSILGNGSTDAPYRVFPPGEYVYHSKRWRICTFDAKWDENHPSYAAVEGVYPAILSTPLRRKLEKTALDCARLFEISGYARIDLRLDEAGRPHILEINPNPDLAPRMGLARAAETAGISYPELMQEIVRLGQVKGPR